MIKVVVTGASGFLGSRVCQFFYKKKKFNIIGTYNNKKEKLFCIKKKLNIYKKKKNFYKFFKNPSILIHLAWPDLNNFNSPNHLKKNLPAQKKFLENLIKNGLKNLLVAGTCFEYKKRNGKMSELDRTFPITTYGKSKDSLRKFLFNLKKKYKFNLTWARIFYMYGVHEDRETLTNLLIKSQKNGKYVLLNKNIKRDYLDVEDVAKKIFLLAIKKRDFGIVNICSGKPISLLELVNILRKKYKILPLVKFKKMKDRYYEPKNFFGNNKKFTKVIGLHPLI